MDGEGPKPQTGSNIMMYIGLVFGWFFAILFGVLTISMLLMHNWLQAVLLLLVVLLCLPPVTTLAKNQWALSIHPVLRAVLVVALLYGFGRLLLGKEQTSIYKSPGIKGRFTQIYDRKMAEWPLPYEDIFLETEYGRVHVIASGPPQAPSLLLLHASGVSSWSWKYNIDPLSTHYRTYAIDLIGDAGKSEFTDLKHVMKNGHDQARLYAEIADKLGAQKAYVVGASEGGFIASNFAAAYPERVEKLALLGPMGYSGATQAIIRIALTSFFPLKPIQDATFAWAFSDSSQLKQDYAEWFPLTMTSLQPVKVPPLSISAEQRQALSMPVMFVFGRNDNLVGDPEAAQALVKDIPDVRVEIVDAGHLMGGEVPDQISGLLLAFFGEP
jgi:pimeloyl-ACP methyl ester carboxylesterase